MVGFDRQDHDFPVADPAGSGDRDDFVQDFLQPRVVDPEGDFDFWQESFGVFGFAVLIEIAFLPPVAFDFQHTEAFQRRPTQGGEDLFGQVGRHDGDNLFHRIGSCWCQAGDFRQGRPLAVGLW